MDNLNSVPAWRWALLPIEVLGLGLFWATCWFIAMSILAFAAGLLLGAEGVRSFTLVFNSIPLLAAIFGFGMIRGAWTAKRVGGARTSVIAMAALFVVAIIISARSEAHLAAALQSFAPLIGGTLYLANVRVGKSRLAPTNDNQDEV
jgi:hypothetical protein